MLLSIPNQISSRRVGNNKNQFIQPTSRLIRFWRIWSINWYSPHQAQINYQEHQASIDTTQIIIVCKVIHSTKHQLNIWLTTHIKLKTERNIIVEKQAANLLKHHRPWKRIHKSIWFIIKQNLLNFWRSLCTDLCLIFHPRNHFHLLLTLWEVLEHSRHFVEV